MVPTIALKGFPFQNGANIVVLLVGMIYLWPKIFLLAASVLAKMISDTFMVVSLPSGF